jgi:aminoglycoside 6-adenylyltransferase
VRELEEAIAAWAEKEDAVRAAAVVGSQARSEVPADEWSDLDVVLFAREPDALLERDDWVRRFGRVRLTFLEPTAVGGQRERRVLYEDGSDIDFFVVPLEVLDDPAAVAVAARGFRVLIDKDHALERRLAELPASHPRAAPTQHDFDELNADFLYHVVWAARKLRRGEIFTAKLCVDGYLKWLLLKLLEWEAHSRDPEIDTWHNGRFLERWANPEALEQLRDTYARYDDADVIRALWSTVNLFRQVATETAERIGLAYPKEADAFAVQMTRRTLES